MASWTNKTVVICGGSSGLGFHLAKACVREHARLVVVLGRDRPRLELAIKDLKVVAEQAGAATCIEAFTANLVDAESTRIAVAAIAQTAPAIDLLVQCIGVSDRGSIAQLSRQRLLDQIDLNVVTSLHAIQYFSPLMVKNKGTIVLIGSLSSLFAPRFLGGYSMAKHALAGLAQQARLELAEAGTHVMLCCPGPIDRPDSGTRYNDRAEEGMSSAALKPGGGAKIDRLDPVQLAAQILSAASLRRPLLILPKKAWWLRLITALSQSLGDRLLKYKSQ